MEPIKVKKQFIITTLNKNKVRYGESIKALLEEWKKLDDAYQEEYREYSGKVYEQTLTNEDKKPCQPPEPKDRTKDYDFWIGYLADDLQEEQTLHEVEYRKLILDQWDWMSSHVGTLRWYSDAAEGITGFGAGAITSDSIMSSSANVIRRAHRTYADVLSL